MNRPDVRPGDRIRLIEMGPDLCPIPAGSTGTVTMVISMGDGVWQVSVRWDIHRSLKLVWPTDRFEVIERPAAAMFREAERGNDR